jgi:hypothetical protein
MGKVIKYDEFNKSRQKGKMNRYSLALFVISFLVLSSIGALALSPSGASITPQGSPERSIADPAIGVPAQAGNITEIDINGFSTTQTWQGYFGNVTGTIELTDGNNYSMYNWSAASPKGEIYASTNQTGIQWQYVQCLNFTAYGNDSTPDLLNAGGTSKYGANLSVLEKRFNVTEDDADGVNETFNLLGGASGHREFYTSNLRFAPGQCQSTRIFANLGYGEQGKFEEVLLYEPASASVIFTTLLDRDSMGFDQARHDFEMLVLEDGHRDNVVHTPYFFYVEIE